MASIIWHQVTTIGPLALTAVGVIVSLLAYRRSAAAKTFDARVELRTAEVDLENQIASLEPLMRRAQGSKTNSLAADGVSQSGAHDVWERVLGKDRLEATDLASELAKLKKQALTSNLSALENRRVTIHRLAERARHIAERYESSLADNARKVEARRAERAACVVARMSTNPGNK